MIFTTIIRSIDLQTRKITIYRGPNVPGLTVRDAQKYCDDNGLGYCEVDGRYLEDEENSLLDL